MLHFSESALEDLNLYIPHGQALKPYKLSIAIFHPLNLYGMLYILLIGRIFTAPAQTIAVTAGIN